MGCASSTPMIQNSGSEMLKAATHVATDATKTVEDAVEGLKDNVGKSLDTAKDSVTTAVESVKHEVENVVKEKSEMMEDAKNSIMEKLHLKQSETESSINENSENIVKTETDELKTQLSENIKNNTDDNDAPASSKIEQTVAMKEIGENIATKTDTETDSLKTSTPEPEIERAFAKSQNNQEDENDNPPTPKPTLAELENLTAEFIEEKEQEQKQQGTTMVNDLTTMSNDSVISVKHENIKTLDSSNNMMSLIADNNTIKDNEPTTTTTALENNDFKATNVHITPKNATAVHTNHFQPVATVTNTLAATTTRVTSVAAAHQVNAVEDKGKQKESKNYLKEKKVFKKTEEKRPRTTEWEKFADMLAQVRKFHPHDAFRRGGTYTKFGGAGIGPLRERSFLGHHIRGGMDDDVSDTTSYFRGSPQNSERSSARVLGRISRLPYRPNTGSNRRNHYYELPANNGGGHYTNKLWRNNYTNSSTTGRKFDYNPTRSRVNEFVSSTPLIQASFLQNTVAAQMPYAPYSTSYECVTSPTNMRSHHSRSDMITLPPLESQERLRAHSQSSQNHQHYGNFAVDHSGNIMKPPIDLHNTDTPIFIRQSSNISLSSNSSDDDNLNSIQSTHLDVSLQTTKLPTVKNTSSFLTTPRCSPFSLRKSYTDLYFSTTDNKENKPKDASDKSPFRKQKKSYNACSNKHFIK